MPDDQADKAGKETPLTPEERRAVWADFHQTQEVMKRYHGRPDTHGDGPTLRGDEEPYPKYYLMFDTRRPVRRRGQRHFPEMLNAEGVWERLPFQKFDEDAEPTTKEEFDKKVAHFTDGKGAKE